MQEANEACSQAAPQVAAAPTKAPVQTTEGKSLDSAIALEAGRHDVTFPHRIDVRLADMRGGKALRSVPMLPGLELKNGKATS
jgi:hypothetical protein